MSKSERLVHVSTFAPDNENFEYFFVKPCQILFHLKKMLVSVIIAIFSVQRQIERKINE